MKMYALRAETKSIQIFGSGNEGKGIVSWRVVAASGPEAAIDLIVKSVSVGALREGVTYQVYEIGDLVGVWHAQYDGEPMIDHRSTSAELVVARRLDLERSLRDRV